MKFESQLQIVTAAGVPPFTVNQTALVINLNADLLDGQHGSYYAAASSLGNYLPLTGGTLTGTLTGTIGIFTTVRTTELTSLLGSNGPITITPDGTGHVHINSTDIRLGPNNTNATLATRGTGDLILRTNEGSAVEGFIRIYDGANGNIEITPNGTGTVVVGKLSGSTASFSGQVTSTVATGTAPLVIASTTAVANLNADLLDGQHGSYYQNASNLNAGTVPSARLSGSYSIDITGNAGSSSALTTNTGSAASALQYWQLSGNSTLNPNTNWWYALRLSHGDADTYYSATIAVDFFNDEIQFRRKQNNVNQTWRSLLHSGNFNSYALPLTGGTITGQLSVNGSTASDILRLYTTGSTVWKLGVTDASGSFFNITADFGNFTINKSNGNVTTPGSFVSTVATGTAPLTVTSTTLVNNLNSQYLNGQLGSYYENRDTTAVGFSGGTLTLTRAAGNLTASLDGRYLPLAGGAMTGSSTISGDNHMTFGPNSTWGSSIRIGGNGYTATGTEMASVVTTDGNLHLDAAKSANGIYLNWYGGTTGVFFGNGASGQVGRVDGSGNASFSGAVTSTYGSFGTPGIIVGDAQYGFYTSSGHLFYKSASTGNHIWRNIANSADTMTLDNSGNLLLSGSLRLTDTTTGISKSGGRLSIRSESTDDVANFASYGLYLPKTGQTAGLYVESAIEARAGIRLGTSAANGTITVGADTANTANRLVQRDGSGNIAVSGIKQGADLARPLASWGVSGTSTGMVIFSFPGGSGNYGMVHCVFDIYEYNSNTVSTVIVGGHNWNGQWYNTGSNVIGRCGKTVRLGFKDGKYCVVFGGAASSWEYGTIVLRKIHNGAFYTGIMDMGGAFTTSQTATESFTWVTGDLRVLRSSAAIISDDYLRGTEVYSSNWFRNDNSGSGIYNSATSNHFYSDGPYWNVAYSGTQGIRFRNGHNGTILGYIYAETDGNFGLLSNNGGWAVQVKPGGGGNLNGTWTINSNTPLTSANYSGYALPLTGGTLTGALTINATGSVLGTAYNHFTYFGGTTAGSIRGSNEGYIVISSNSAGTSDKSIYLNSAASIQFDALSHYRFNKPSTAGYQTVALFGTAASGLFLTTDSPIISTGAYYNNGWIATAASGTLTNYANGAYEWSTFSGATVGSAPALVSRMTLTNAGTLNVVGAITQGGNQVLHAGNFNSYAMLTTGIPSGSDQYVNFRVIRNSAAGNTDGMYIGYGNAGSGRTRIYSEGSTTSHVYPDSSGNLFRSDGAAYLHSSNYTSYTAPNAANLPYSWSNTANVAVFSGSYGYNSGAAKYLLLWQRTSGATGTNGRFVDGMLKVWRGANHAGNDGTVGYVHASSGYSGQSSEVRNYTPFTGQGLTFSSVVYNSVEWIAVAMPVSDYYWEFRGNYGIQGDTTTVPILVQAGQAGVGAVTNLATGSPIITSSTYSLFSSFTGTVSGSNFSGPGTGLTGLAAGLSIGGNAATATNGFTAKPGWAGNQNLIEEITNFNLSKPSGFYQGYQATNSPSATWYNLINVRHSNTANDHGFQLAMSYYDETLWSRSYQGGTGANNGTFTTWRAHLHSGNYSNYALPLTGGTLTGNLSVNTGVIFNRGSAPSITNIQCSIFNELNGISNAESLNFRAYAGFKWQYWDGSATWMQLTSAGLSITGTLNATGAITQGGNQVLHAGNVSTYAFAKSGSWAADLVSSYGFTRETGMQMTGGSEFVVLSKSGQGYLLVDGSYIAAEAGGFYSTNNSSGGTLLGFYADTTASLNFNTTAVKLSGNQVLHAGNYTGYRGVQIVSPNGGTVVAADSAMPDAGNSFIHTLGLGPSGNDGHILGMTWTNTSQYGAQIWLDTDPTNRMAFRSRSNTGVWTGWNEVIHSSNYSSYALPLSGGTLTGALAGTSASFSGALSSGGNAVLTVGNYTSYAVDNTKRVKQFFWDSLSASAAQARRFEIARITIDIVNWNAVGSMEIELSEDEWANGLKKKYVITYGYSAPRANITLTEMSGIGSNNFQVVLGSEQPISGNEYYLPVYVDVRYYARTSVRMTTSRQITSNSTPPRGYTYINASPSPTNISDFSADSTVNMSNAATAWQVGGNTIAHAGNFPSLNTYGTSIGNTLPDRVFMSNDANIKYAPRDTAKAHLGLTGKYGNSRASITGDANYWTGVMGWGTTDWNSVFDWGSGFTDSWSSPANNPGDTSHHVGVQAVHYTNGTSRYGWQMVNGAGTNRWWLRDVWGGSFSSWREILHSANYMSYALPLSGGTLTGSRPVTIDPSGGGLYIKGDTGGWGLGYYFYGSSGTFRGGFGALGSGDSLSNFWVGPAYNNTWMTFSGSANNSQVALQQGGNQVLHAGNYTSYAPPYGSTGSRNVWTITNWNQTTYPNAHFLSSEGNTANAPSTDFIYGLQTAFHRDGASYRTQMVTELYSSPVSMWVRNSRDSDTWTSWAKLVHSLNYTDYTVTKTGAGASGSWGINITGSSASVSASADQAIVNQHNGSGSAWYGRILSKNSTNDRSAFLGTYGSVAGVFAHNNALTAWADLYINTVDGSSGGTVRMPASVLVSGNQVIHTGNYVSYSPSLTGGGASGTWGINISGSSASCSGSAAQLNGQAASYYENRDTTSVSISAGTLTLGRGAGNLTTTIGGRVVAWCDFNGNFASSQSPNASFNVSSITKNATGDYTVNFSSSLGTANYVVAGTAQLDTPSPGQSNYNVMVAVPRRSGAKAAGSCRVVCEYPAGVALYDSISVGVAFIAA